MFNKMYTSEEQAADGAWREGFKAFLNNLSLYHDNPYDNSTQLELWQEWHNGFLDAEMEKEVLDEINTNEGVVYDEY